MLSDADADAVVGLPEGPSLGLALPDRAAVLNHAAELLLRTWRGFDRPRPGQPDIADDVRAMLARPLPEGASDARAALDQAETILDQSLAQPRRRYFAYVPSSALEIGVLGDALVGSCDVNVATTAGGADLVEQAAVRWVSEFIGFGSPHGIMASGGTVSNLTALCAARERAVPGFRRRGLAAAERLTMYCSEEAHYSVRRAAEVLGIGSENVRTVPIDGRRGMVAGACAELIDQDLDDGAVPVAVVATAGTTLTGAVDDLDALADVCMPRSVWLHVDGAYGLPAAATVTAGWRFRGLDRADSATVDAHKWLFVPKACSVLLVRDRHALGHAFSHEEHYIPHDEGGRAHPVDRTLEYSRPLRALKLWLAFTVHGAAALRCAIERNLAQAAHLAERVRAAPNFELLAEPQLSAVCFRHVAAPRDHLDRHNRQLARAIQRRGDIYLAPAEVDGRACLRVCFVNFRTLPEDVDAILPAVLDAARDCGA